MAMAKTRGTETRNRNPLYHLKNRLCELNAIKYSIYNKKDTAICSLCNEKTKYNTHFECVFNFGLKSI